MTPDQPPDSLSAFIDKVLAEYPDEHTKEACDRCEQCGPMVMCSFHSILSLLSGETGLSDKTRRSDYIERSHAAEIARLTAERDHWKNGTRNGQLARIALKRAEAAEAERDALRAQIAAAIPVWVCYECDHWFMTERTHCDCGEPVTAGKLLAESAPLRSQKEV